MSRIKEWLGSDSNFEDIETNGNGWRQIKAGQPVPEVQQIIATSPANATEYVENKTDEN